MHWLNSNKKEFNDKLLTQKVKEAGQILDLPLLDHIIVTQ
ncbi:JAB domain-containing protein [Aquiflexum lacus]|nr:JAB domain-containing protein [Aquiflexum lacus]